MSNLCYMCLFALSGVQHILCGVFCSVCLRLMPPMLTVSLDCPFFIAPSVFSNVYFTPKILREIVTRSKCIKTKQYEKILNSRFRIVYYVN